MLHKTRGIVLHYIKYGESGIIVQIYTEVFGRQSYIINGIRSKKSQVRMSYFQPLTILELEAYFRTGRDIHRIKEIKFHIPLTGIQQDICKSTIAIFIAEILYKTLNEAEQNLSMFEFLNSSIQFLDVMTTGVSNFHLVFLVQYSKHLGIFPKSDLNRLTGNEPEEKLFFHLSDYHFFDSLDKNVKDALFNLNEKSFQDLAEIKIDYQTRMILLDKFLAYYRFHFENIGQIKSLQVLKEVFHLM